MIYQYIRQCMIMEHCVEEYLGICKNGNVLSEYIQKYEENIGIMTLRWITQQKAE